MEGRDGVLMRRAGWLLGLAVVIGLALASAAAAVQPVSPANGSVYTANPPQTFRWTLGPNEQSCGVTITENNPESPWQYVHDSNTGGGWTMSLGGDGSSATIDNQDPLVWGLYYWTVYTAAADYSDGACNPDGTGPRASTFYVSVGPVLDVSNLDTYTGSSQVRVLSVAYSTVRVMGAPDRSVTSMVALSPSPYAPAIRRGYVTVPWTCRHRGEQDVYFTASDGTRSDLLIGQPCSQRFSFGFGGHPVFERDRLNVSIYDAWSANVSPYASALPVSYRLCASGPRMHRCFNGHYDLTTNTGAEISLGSARRGWYRFTLYVDATRVAQTRVLVHHGVHCYGTIWRTLRDGDQICPRNHSLIADYGLVGLRWSSWNGSTARATGYLSCFGSGCQGVQSQPVAITLSRRQNCPDGARIYSRYDARFLPPYVQSIWPSNQLDYRIPCSGETGGGNG